MTDFICNDLIEMIGKKVVSLRNKYELDRYQHRIKWHDVKCAIFDIGIYRDVDNDKCIKVSLFAMKQNLNQNWLRGQYVCDCCLDQVKASDSKRCGTCEGIFCPECIGNFSGPNDCNECSPDNDWDNDDY